MKTLCLIDGDIVAYRCSAAAENYTQETAETWCDDLIRRIVHETNTLTYKVYLGGKTNFRKEIYPEYKANRKGKPRPIWLEACRNHLIKYHNAYVTENIEADDALGIEQTNAQLDSVIASIDKDLLQIPGWHYDFVKCTEQFISPTDGLRKFYGQLITGDASDNIPSCDGFYRSKHPKHIQLHLAHIESLSSGMVMYEYVKEVYQTHGVDLDEMHKRAQCLYILKETDKYWQIPNGQMEDDTHSLSAS